MSREFRATDWDRYKMNMRDPHREIEPLEEEVAVVDQALAALVEAGVLKHANYDGQRFLAMRQAVAHGYEIPWTAITPRMQRAIYAINAVHQPAHMIAAGIFCGNTFTCNAGAAIGPGACYQAVNLVGLEIKPEEADRAARNVRTIDPQGRAKILAQDAVAFVAGWQGPIDLLYLDADGAGGRGKGIYLDIVQAGYDRIPAGGLVLAHNSVNLAHKLEHYLAFVRDPANFRASVNLVLDGEGLEVSVK